MRCLHLLEHRGWLPFPGIGINFQAVSALSRYELLGCIENEMGCLPLAKYVPVSFLGYLETQLSSQMGEGVRAL